MKYIHSKDERRNLHTCNPVHNADVIKNLHYFGVDR